MNNDEWEKYWKGRWERGETGWHQREVEPQLIENFSDLTPTRVLVPLCGKSHDLIWLQAQGHEVIGVEMSEKACQSFFVENEIDYRIEKHDRFNAYISGKITIFNGDIFETRAEDLNEFGALYDRAALIALDPELRIRYAKHITALILSCTKAESFRMLQIVLERIPHDNAGPPFSVPAQELEKLYDSQFKIKSLGREPIDMQSSNSAKILECVYGLTRITHRHLERH